MSQKPKKQSPYQNTMTSKKNINNKGKLHTKSARRPKDLKKPNAEVAQTKKVETEIEILERKTGKEYFLPKDDEGVNDLVQDMLERIKNPPIAANNTVGDISFRTSSCPNFKYTDGNNILKII